MSRCLEPLTPANLHFIAQGGEHLVYHLRSHPRLVAKFSLRTIKMMLAHNEARHQPAHHLPHSFKQELQQAIQQDAARVAQLKQYFGPAHILPRRKQLCPVPVTTEMVAALPLPANLDHIWTIVTLQRWLSRLAHHDYHSLATGYAEMHPLPPNYETLTAQLITNDKRPFSLTHLLHLQNLRTLNKLITRAHSDDALNRLLRHLVTTIITYSQQTGEILDLASPGNLIFYQQDGTWTYHLTDALYPHRGDMLTRTQQALHRHLNGQPLTAKEANILLNGLNFTRTLNALARHFGLPQQIRLLDDTATLTTLNVGPLLRPIFEPTTP